MSCIYQVSILCTQRLPLFKPSTMADPYFHSPTKPHFFQPLLPGFQHHLNMPANFFKKHVEGRHEHGDTKITLMSDVSDRTWEVKMEGRRLADGWEEFAADHDFRVRDIIVFRLEGDMVFHVTGFGPSSCNLQYTSSLSDHDDSEDDDVKDQNDDDGEDNDNDEENTDDSTYVPSIAACSSDEETGRGECSKALKTSPTRTHSNSPRQNRFLTLTLTNYKLNEARLPLPLAFTREHDIERPGNMILVDKHGGDWHINLWRCKRSGTMVLGKGLRSFFRANGFKDGESFAMELIWRDATPVLKLSSECIESREHETVAVAHGRPEETRQRIMSAEAEAQTHERVRVCVRGRGPVLDHEAKAAPVRGTTAETSRSDSIAKARQSVTDALTAIRRFRELLHTTEQDLGASLRELELDALGQEH